MRRFCDIHLISFLLICVLFAPKAVSADSSNDREVKQLSKSARTAYKNGLYETAANQFSQAFELSGNPNFLYDAAISFQQIQQWEQCVGFMGRYLELAPISPKRDRARNARDNCEARRAQSQTLRIETNPPLATVRLGNKKNPIVGTTPLVLKRPPGVQRIFIEKEGYQSVIRDVELQSGTPLLLSIDLKEVESTGYLFVDASVIGATVFVNGKSIRLTPFDRPLELKSGSYQVNVNRPGFQSSTNQVDVKPLTVHLLELDVRPLEHNSSWRTPVGWVSGVLGFLSVAGGAVATRYADTHYNDTEEFRRLARFEKIGYGVGGSLITAGVGLLLWDAFRNQILTQDRNPRFGAPIEMPSGAVNVERVGVP